MTAARECMAALVGGTGSRWDTSGKRTMSHTAAIRTAAMAITIHSCLVIFRIFYSPNVRNERTATRGAAGAYAAGVPRVSGTLHCMVGPLHFNIPALPLLLTVRINTLVFRANASVINDLCHMRLRWSSLRAISNAIRFSIVGTRAYRAPLTDVLKVCGSFQSSMNRNRQRISLIRSMAILTFISSPAHRY